VYEITIALQIYNKYTQTHKFLEKNKVMHVNQPINDMNVRKSKSLSKITVKLHVSKMQKPTLTIIDTTL